MGAANSNVKSMGCGEQRTAIQAPVLCLFFIGIEVIDTSKAVTRVVMDLEFNNNTSVQDTVTIYAGCKYYDSEKIQIGTFTLPASTSTYHLDYTFTDSLRYDGSPATRPQFCICFNSTKTASNVTTRATNVKFYFQD